ncbi:hypothetical protein JCM19235_2771 [Vibrio maritimus]|uniref:Uncharacterized protein n=1 Tax=Vibrio maritimus TaxID=990268 RepID=A0A090SRV2_9VIBR|nr:hypothetical protein JCM19235_2771 [Vibrio maritimus]
MIIFEFDDHPTPEYFTKPASFVIKDFDELDINESSSVSDDFDIEDYFCYNENYRKKIVDVVCTKHFQV